MVINSHFKDANPFAVRDTTYAYFYFDFGSTSNMMVGWKFLSYQENIPTNMKVLTANWLVDQFGSVSWFGIRTNWNLDECWNMRIIAETNDSTFQKFHQGAYCCGNPKTIVWTVFT